MTAPRVELTKLARHAIAYAAKGWHVFPLAPRKKEPLIAKGFLTATNNVEQVRAWWTKTPNANVGLWPGQSGLVIVDIDSAQAEAIARRFGLFAEPTLECRTGRQGGGRHLYFKRPAFHVSNAKPFTECNELEVRGDAGYVVLPPSIHPSGTPYAWEGLASDIHELPPQFLEALEKAQSRQGPSAAASGVAREIAFLAEISAGGRNNTLTQYAGRLLAKGIGEEETLSLLSAMNLARCKPPLAHEEVNAIVANIARKEAAKPLRIVRNDAPLDENSHEPEPDSQDFSRIPSPADLAAEQIATAQTILTRDLSTAPRWSWIDVDRLLGPMLPGDLVVVGALMGNGKSTLLMSQMDAFAEQKRRTLYVPLEIDPAVCRVRWAAWKLGLDVRHVIRQDWYHLPEGSREAIDGVLAEQESNRCIHFATPRRMTFSVLADWCRWAKDEAGCTAVMLDHFHRLEFGDSRSHRIDVTEVARRLKDLARELGLVMIAAAQLNRSADPVDQYIPPQLSRLKESAGIGEEADVVVTLSRKLRRDLPQHWQQNLRLGQLSEIDISEPNAMVVTCRKHRLDDSALNRSALLTVVNGKLQNRARSWQL